MRTDLFSLVGRVAVVTGGSRGLGAVSAEALLAYGAARVYITARKAEACRATAAALNAAYDGECIDVPADLSTIEGCRAFAAEIASREEVLDVLVNNAGAVWAAPFDEFSEHGWDKVMDLNVKSLFFLTQALAGHLRGAASSKRPAKVINIASIDGLAVGAHETYSYHASKAALLHLTRHMAARLIADHVVVSAICPGEFPSALNPAARDHPEELAASIPAGRVGFDDDIAGAIVYLASKAGDYVVGESITVDGGIVNALPQAVQMPS